MTPNPNPSPELLPCPFCGGEAACDSCAGVGRVTYTVGCNNNACDADCHFTGFEGYAPLVAAWNTRALSQTLPAPVSHASHTTGVVSHVDGIGDSRPLPAPGNVERLKDRIAVLERENLNYAKTMEIIGQLPPAPGEVEARAAHIAAYSGPVVSFDVTAPYYLASCDSCGWVGSSEHCGTDTGCDDSNVYCPRCDASGADCGKIATQNPPWTLATVAAANDEGVARIIDHSAWAWHDRWLEEAATETMAGRAASLRKDAKWHVKRSLDQAAQIRILLSQGGGKA